MFLRMQTQWVVGYGALVGLNYQSLEFLFKIYNVKNRKNMMEEIRLIERGALEAMKREREKEGKK